MTVKIIWASGRQTSEIGKIRKVYKEKFEYTPSGLRKFFLVWNDVLGRCVWTKATNCEVI